MHFPFFFSFPDEVDQISSIVYRQVHFLNLSILISRAFRSANSHLKMTTYVNSLKPVVPDTKRLKRGGQHFHIVPACYLLERTSDSRSKWESF